MEGVCSSARLVLQIVPELELVGLVFLALYVVLSQVDRSLSLVAVTAGLSGVTICVTSNTALTMLSLSTKYAIAATGASEPWSLHARCQFPDLVAGFGRSFPDGQPTRLFSPSTVLGSRAVQPVSNVAAASWASYDWVDVGSSSLVELLSGSRVGFAGDACRDAGWM